MRLIWAFCASTLILEASVISRVRFGIPLSQGPLIKPLFWSITVLTCICWAFEAWMIRKRKGRGNR